MKRNWDLLRHFLIEVEEEKDIFAGFPDKPEWTDQTEEEYSRQYKEYEEYESHFFGHLELLTENGYIDGINVLRSMDGYISCGTTYPRLTMKGHDLLDTMRSSPVWESIKSTARSKGIELTFDAIKALGAVALRHLIN
ncbi:DUF2513 domain-containing protein [Salmonella enterica]|nr:DUF2513 domain-containing protein [Salmonella enterica]